MSGAVNVEVEGTVVEEMNAEAMDEVGMAEAVELGYPGIWRYVGKPYLLRTRSSTLDAEARRE